MDAASSPARLLEPLERTSWLRERERAENFPVALRLLPVRHRAHLRAVYEVVRLIDDTGDRADGDRLALLDSLSDDLRLLWCGGTPRSATIRRLGPTVRETRLPRQPFEDLIEANRQDQRVRRYETFDQLLGYCALSAVPIGRIVLSLFDVRDPRAPGLSDRVSTALQLLEHWQDIGEDRRAGRVYLPLEDLRAWQVQEHELDAPVAGPRLRRLVLAETARAEAMLREGATLVPLLRGVARLAVAGYVGGGLATARAIRRHQGEVLGGWRRPRRLDLLTAATRAWTGARP